MRESNTEHVGTQMYAGVTDYALNKVQQVERVLAEDDAGKVEDA